MKHYSLADSFPFKVTIRHGSLFGPAPVYSRAVNNWIGSLLISVNWIFGWERKCLASRIHNRSSYSIKLLNIQRQRRCRRPSERGDEGVEERTRRGRHSWTGIIWLLLQFWQFPVYLFLYLPLLAPRTLCMLHPLPRACTSSFNAKASAPCFEPYQPHLSEKFSADSQ